MWKTFGLVELAYLTKLLMHMGFEQKIVNALHALYEKPNTQLRVNDTTSQNSFYKGVQDKGVPCHHCYMQ